MLLQPTHKKLLRQQLRKSDPSESGQRKKRRTARSAAIVEQTPVIVDISDVSGLSSDELEDVELAGSEQEATLTGTKTAIENNNGGYNDDVDDFDDLEDVDLEQMFDVEAKDTHDPAETLTFTLNQAEDAALTQNKKKRAFTPISKEERLNRKQMHKLLLMSYMCHGAVRNKWCNDKVLQQLLRGILPLQVVLMFHQDSEQTLDYVKARKFIDGLRTVMLVFAKKFKVTFSGLSRPDWKPVEVTKLATERSVSATRFRRLVRAFQGSRDIQAQGLVALLRCIGINARLIFSVQVPDYKSLRPANEEQPKASKLKEPKPQEPRSEFDPVFIPNGRKAILSGIRAQLPSDSSKKETATSASKFPIFWVEVWNKYSKKWITVDSAVFKVVEVQPMRRKGKFEAPLSDETHQTWYVIAYDKRGVVKDVTRRYTQYYNAKTVKKRIGFDSDDDQHWYEQALRVIGKPDAPVTEAEAYELKEFRDRHVCEGIPNNMADFKNHPVYALESQLRQDEIIYPKDDTSKCGTFRSSNKNSTIPIYKRSHVYHLKTPKAWHMRGRVLKMGARPLKTKPLKSGGLYADGSADLDDEVRLYAEFQTEIFRPPPITNGIIEKNAYGNVEIFVPSMMPENGYLARVSPTVTIKMLEKAAKYVLKIDYAKAIVSFDFGNFSKSKRTPTATEGGILIDQQYKEALDTVIEGLEEEEEDIKRRDKELSALKYWNFFLKKLRIMRRLNDQHGAIGSDLEDEAMVNTNSHGSFEHKSLFNRNDGSADGGSEEEGYYSVGSDEEISDNEQYIPRPTRTRRRQDSDFDGSAAGSEDGLTDGAVEAEEGGFFVEDSEPKISSDHGQENREDNFSGNEEGGFFMDLPTDDVSEKKSPHSVDEDKGEMIPSPKPMVDKNNANTIDDFRGHVKKKNPEIKKDLNSSFSDTETPVENLQTMFDEERLQIATINTAPSKQVSNAIDSQLVKISGHRNFKRGNLADNASRTQCPKENYFDTNSCMGPDALTELRNGIEGPSDHAAKPGGMTNVSNFTLGPINKQTSARFDATQETALSTRQDNENANQNDLLAVQGIGKQTQLLHETRSRDCSAHTIHSRESSPPKYTDSPHVVVVSSGDESPDVKEVLSADEKELLELAEEETQLGFQYSDSE